MTINEIREITAEKAALRKKQRDEYLARALADKIKEIDARILYNANDGLDNCVIHRMTDYGLIDAIRQHYTQLGYSVSCNNLWIDDSMTISWEDVPF